MAALWSLIGVGVFSIAAIVLDGHTGPTLSMIAALGWLVVLPLTWPLRGERRVSDLAFLAGFVFFLSFGLRSIVLLSRSQPTLPGVPTDPAVIAGFLPIHQDALLLAIVCWIVFTIGYRAPLGASLGAALPDWQADRLSPGRVAAVVLVFGAVGWVARLRFRAAHNTFEVLDPNRVGADETILTWLGVLATTALVLALLGAALYPRNWVFIAMAGTMTIAEIGFALYSGIRTPIFSVALALVAFAPMRLKLRRRWILFAAPVILLVFGATVVYRNPEVFSQARQNNAAQRFETTLERSVELGPVGLTEIALWNLSARYHGPDSVGQVLLLGTKVQSGVERYVLAVPSALIPRFIWRDKPTTIIGIEFARTYFGLTSDQNDAFAPTWVGDFLLSFPPPVVPLCLLVMGFLVRILNDYGWRAVRSRSVGFVPYALILPVAVQSDAWVSVGIYQVTQIIIIAIAVAIALRVGSPANQLAAAPARQVTSTG